MAKLEIKITGRKTVWFYFFRVACFFNSLTLFKLLEKKPLYKIGDSTLFIDKVTITSDDVFKAINQVKEEHGTH